MSKTATVVGEVGGYPTTAIEYVLSEPLDGNERVIVFALSGARAETIITSVGGPSINKLPGSVSGFTDHGVALGISGYTIKEATDGA